MSEYNFTSTCITCGRWFNLKDLPPGRLRGCNCVVEPPEPFKTMAEIFDELDVVAVDQEAGTVTFGPRKPLENKP